MPWSVTAGLILCSRVGSGDCIPDQARQSCEICSDDDYINVCLALRYRHSSAGRLKCPACWSGVCTGLCYRLYESFFAGPIIPCLLYETKFGQRQCDSCPHRPLEHPPTRSLEYVAKAASLFPRFYISLLPLSETWSARKSAVVYI